jgi:hypothetical protein
MRCNLRLAVTSKQSAILMNRMPLFIPNCLRSKAIVQETVPEVAPLLWSRVKVNLSCLVRPRIVESPSPATVLGTAF